MNHRAHITPFALPILILTSLAYGCQSAAPSPTPAFQRRVDQLSNGLPQQPVELSAVPTSAPEAAAADLPALEIPFQVDDSIIFEPVSAPLPAPQPEPLRLVFPAPSKPPVTAWRPALYPIPWAPLPYDHFYFARPVAANEIYWPVWDYRYGGNFIEDVYHTGIDIPTPNGTPVLAAGSGKVVWAGYGLYRGYEDKTDPYGLSVGILHDFGYQNQPLFTVYGHMNQADVVPGQQVAAGDVLGLSGETGNVTGPHLHFEVRIGENGFFYTRNPELWLAPPQGWGVLAGRVMNTASQLLGEQRVIVHSQSSDQNWIVQTYGPIIVNSDPYYQENLVLSDLPAGLYLIRIPYAGTEHRVEIEILPGRVSYFSFYGHKGFEVGLPPPPGADFNPSLDTAGLP